MSSDDSRRLNSEARCPIVQRYSLGYTKKTSRRRPRQITIASEWSMPNLDLNRINFAPTGRSSLFAHKITDKEPKNRK
jgi:hypothetical protein